MEEQHRKEVFELEVRDRESARQTYRKDAQLQKVFAIAFLVLFFGMVFYLIHVYVAGVVLSSAANTMLSTLVGYTSAKMNTIVDFLFGGSMGSGKQK